MYFYYENELAGKEKAKIGPLDVRQLLVQCEAEGGLWDWQTVQKVLDVVQSQPPEVTTNPYLSSK